MTLSGDGWLLLGGADGTAAAVAPMPTLTPPEVTADGRKAVCRSCAAVAGREGRGETGRELAGDKRLGVDGAAESVLLRPRRSRQTLSHSGVRKPAGRRLLVLLTVLAWVRPVMLDMLAMLVMLVALLTLLTRLVLLRLLFLLRLLSPLLRLLSLLVLLVLLLPMEAKDGMAEWADWRV